MARILAVDDDPDILLILDHTLTREGHQVVTSSDSARVVTLAHEHHVDAVILDIMMPGVSGYEALRSLRDGARTGGVPILFLSALAESEDRVRGLREGADDYLTKPFDVEELVLRIDRLVAPRIQAPAPSFENSQESYDQRLKKGQFYLGRYQALEVVGQGAMGLVFRGWDPRLKRPVALKTLRLDRFVSDRDRDAKVDRLIDEAVTIARLNHPNIVSVFDADTNSEMAYIALEFVEGRSLAQRLEGDQRLPPRQVMLLALGISRALAAAHESHIVHHDIKPGNILLGRDGSIKISDFGVASVVQALVRPGDKVGGTVGYLPPEVLEGGVFTPGGDLFALGVVLYKCLTGLRAFPGATLPKRIYSTLSVDVVAPRQLDPEIPRPLEELVLELLSKDQDLRLSTASEAVRRLTAMIDGQITDG